MVKMNKTTKKSMKKRNEEAKKFFLKDESEQMSKYVLEGFLFSFDDLNEGCMEYIEWVPNAQYALIDIFFSDYVNYVENSGEWTQQEANNIDELDEYFHEILRGREMFRFKNKKITTIQEAIKEFKKINFFPPSIVIKDGLMLNFRNYFDNVVYF